MADLVAELRMRTRTIRSGRPRKGTQGRRHTVLKSNHCVLMTSVPMTSSVV